jgi:hypothetical protein
LSTGALTFAFCPTTAVFIGAASALDVPDVAASASPMATITARSVIFIFIVSSSSWNDPILGTIRAVKRTKESSESKHIGRV